MTNDTMDFQAQKPKLSASEVSADGSLNPQPGQSDQVLARVANAQNDFSRAFSRVARFLTAAPQKVIEMSLNEMATAAGVSEPTIMRFCRSLGYSGVPEFRIALAMNLAAEDARSAKIFVEPHINDKLVVRYGQKLAIAQYALDLVKTDRNIIIDNGSTMQCFAQHLSKASELMIFTTGLNIVQALQGAKHHKIILAGGNVRYESQSVSGRIVERQVADMSFDTFYLAADALDPKTGLSTYNDQEAHQTAAMIKVSRRVVLLADSAKFKAPSLHRVCDWKDIHVLVTDAGLPEDIAAMIEAAGVELHRAPAVGG